MVRQKCCSSAKSVVVMGMQREAKFEVVVEVEVEEEGGTYLARPVLRQA